jgi:hypothetical protein
MRVNCFTQAPKYAIKDMDTEQFKFLIFGLALLEKHEKNTGVKARIRKMKEELENQRVYEANYS